MHEQLKQIYQMAQEKLTEKGEVEDIYVEIGKKKTFNELGDSMKQLVLFTEPDITPHTLITLEFGHFNAHSQNGPFQPECYVFDIRWKRSQLPEGAKVAIDGVNFRIEPTEQGLKYELNSRSSNSNILGASRSGTAAQMVRNAPETAFLLTQEQEIETLLELQEFQDKLLEEFVSVFLQR